MSSLRAEFRFEIGDTVYFRAAMHNANNRPNQFIIYERLAQQCHGGIQQLYRMQPGMDFVAETLLTADEPEYRPATEHTRVMCELPGAA